MSINQIKVTIDNQDNTEEKFEELLTLVSLDLISKGVTLSVNEIVNMLKMRFLLEKKE